MNYLDALIEQMAEFRNDPLGFVDYSFPWGEEGTSLSGWAGPNEWQTEILTLLGQGLLTVDEAIQIAIASGHGIGKSAFVAWLILWGIATYPDTRGVVTANTEAQLRTKTWAELGKWFNLFIARDLFHLTATAIFSKDKAHQRTWRIDMVPWSEKNTEAFAGLHNQGKRIMLIMDEASAIPDIIWETAEGALTDKGTEIIWFNAGNPTRNSGRFRECFRKNSHRWIHRNIDSRTVPHTNAAQFAKWEEDYGVDSDFFKIRVRGEFPDSDESEFISAWLVEQAQAREILSIPSDEPWVIGVDVGGRGTDGDLTVLWPRRGVDARSGGVERYSGKDTQEIADLTLAMMRRLNTTLVAVDGGGLGAGVVDRLRRLGVDVVDANFGGRTFVGQGREIGKYANRRAELWGSLRDWLKTGALPQDTTTVSEMTGPRYTLNQRDEIQLERKDAMRSRGVDSPDSADALACTFAIDTSFLYALNDNWGGGPSGVDYNPYEGIRGYV